MVKRTPGRVSEQDEGPRVVARTIRGPVKPAAITIALYTFVAWGGSFFLFAYFTAAGQLTRDVNGFWPIFLNWLLLSAFIAGGHGLGYKVLDLIVLGQKPFSRRRVARLAAGDALAAMAGGYALGFFPLTLMPDPLLLLGWAVVVGYLFSFAVLSPLYARRFERAVAAGETVRDSFPG